MTRSSPAPIKPTPDLAVLETLIDTARMSAQVANYLLTDMLGATEPDGDTVRTTNWKREMLLFATGRAASDAEEANAAFLDALNAGLKL